MYTPDLHTYMKHFKYEQIHIAEDLENEGTKILQQLS